MIIFGKKPRPDEVDIKQCDLLKHIFLKLWGHKFCPDCGEEL